MQITVQLFGLLRKKIPGYDPEAGIQITVEAGSTVEDLLRGLDLADANIGLVTVNQEIASKKAKLQEGSTVRLFHSLFGG